MYYTHTQKTQKTNAASNDYEALFSSFESVIMEAIQ